MLCCWRVVWWGAVMVGVWAGVVGGGERGVCEVGLEKQLFLDDFVVDQMVDVRRVFNRAERFSDRPIVVAEHPWEGQAVVAPIVLRDDELGIFRMYYWAHYDKDDRIFTCYATSKDGIQWEKPMLGLYEGPDGTKNNNIVLRGEGRQARMRYVVRNPYASGPEEKYVAMYIDNVPGLTEFIAYSPDGVQWKTAVKIGDLRGVTGGAPTANPRYFLIEQKWDDSKVDHRYRGIWRTESADLKTWTGGIWIVQLEPDDDRDLEFYHAVSHFLGSQTYHGLHLGYLFPFRTKAGGQRLTDGTRMAGTVDVELMISRDTIRWTRVDRKGLLFECGKEGSWDAGMVYVSPEVVVGDEVRFYYGGWALDHAAEKNRGAIGLARLRLDGFACLEAKGKPGVVVTRPLRLEGGVVEMNVEAAGGQVVVEVLDEDGRAIPEYSREKANAVKGVDAVRMRPTWQGRGDVSELRGKVVRLRFYLDNAKLYAFQVCR